MINTKKKSLGESLVEKGLVAEEQLRQAEFEARSSSKPLRKILIKKGLISEEDLTAFLSQQFDLPLVDLTNYLVEPEIIDLIPEGLARKHLLIPILRIGNDLTVAMVDPLDVFALDELHMKTGLNIEPALATETRPAACRKLVAEDDLYRLRVEDYRIIYFIDDGNQRVVISRVAHRREVYR